MARPKGPRKLYRYTDEFKLKAVKLTELPGVRVQDVAEALDVHPWMLSRWRTTAARGAFSRTKKVSLEVTEQQEVKELGKVRRELALLTRLTPSQYQRPAVFEGYGPVTFGGLVHYLCSHDQQHLAGLQWLLGKIEAHARVHR
jgi:transposase-like protein